MPKSKKWHYVTWVQYAESIGKSKYRQSFWSTLLLMIQTFVFVRNLGSFSSAPSPSFEVRPSFTVMRQRSEALLRKWNCGEQQRCPTRARHTRVRRFSIFCLHLFTSRAYLSENECFACEGFTFHRKPSIFLSFSNLGVKATAFTSARTVGNRRHYKNGGAECPSPRRCGGWRQGAKIPPLCLHPQHTVQQMITKNFNARLHNESFTHNRL